MENQSEIKQENVLNPSENTFEPRELSPISLIAGHAFKIFKGIVWRYIGLTFLPLLFALPLVGILLFYAFSQLSSAGASTLNIVFAVLGFASMIVLMVVVLITQVSIFSLPANFLDDTGVWGLFKKSKKIAWKFFVVNLVAGAFAMLWGVLFIIPGIIAAIYYSFAPWAFLVDGYEGTAAIKRSKEIIKGHWWSLFIRLVLPYFVFFLLSVGPTFLVNNSGFQIAWVIVTNVLSYLFTAFYLAYLFVLYKDFVRIKGPSEIQNKKGKSGGVVLAVLLLIAFLAVLPTLAVVSLKDARGKAEEAMVVSTVKQIQTSLEMQYMMSDGEQKYPASLDELEKGNPFLFSNEEILKEYDLNYKSNGRSYDLCFTLENQVGNFSSGVNCLKGGDTNIQVKKEIKDTINEEAAREKEGLGDDDGDGLTNAEEETYGTNKNMFDTDGDGYGDGAEVMRGYNPNGAGKL